MRILPSRPSAMLRRLATPFSLVALVALLSVADTVPIAVATDTGQNDPSAVTNLILSSESPGELTISWSAPDQTPSDYRLAWAEEGLQFLSYRSSSNEPNRGNEYPGGQETSLTLTGLTKGATFKVQIRSRYKVAGSDAVLRSGPWTNEVTVRIKHDSPGSPSGLVASSVAEDSVTINWTAPDNSSITGYRVFRGADAKSRAVIADDTASTDTTFTDTTVAAATEYVYAVLALSLDGDGAESDILSVTTPNGLTELDGLAGDAPKSVEITDERNDENNENDENDQSNVEVITVTFPQPSFAHDGHAEFEFHLDFSHQPENLGWRTFKDEALSVQGASVGRVWRREAGTHQFWGAMLTPDGYGDITVTINGTTNCSDEHAVCDTQGIMLLGGEQHVIHGPLTLSLSEPVVQEDVGATLDFVVSLSRASDQAITVSYQTEDGTATAESDYTATSGSLTFDIGQTEKTVSVAVLENVGDLGQESVVFHLSSPSGAILIDEFALGTIVDLVASSQQQTNLNPPTVSVADAVVMEGPGATLDFVVSLSHVSDQAVSVTYRTENGTGNGVALSTSDYHAASGRLTFDAGETQQTASVRVREDEEQDGQETLTLLLTSAVGATFADAEATGTILNTPKGARLPAYYGHDRPDWSPGQISPTSITSTEDHTIDVAWASPISYIPYRFRVNFAPVDPEVADGSFPWEGAEDGNHWAHYPFATSTRVTGLTGGVEYKVRVQAQIPAIGESPARNGPWSLIMKVTVAGEGAPSPPLATASAVSSPTLDQYATGQLTSVTLTSSEPGNILVEWIPASSPTGDRGRIPPDDYRVSWVKGDGTFPSDSDTAGNADVMGASYTLTGLENGQTYRVRVRANYPAGSLYLQPAWAGPWTEVQIVVASPDSDPKETTTRVVLVPAVIPEAVVAQVPDEYVQGQLATMTIESPEAGNIDVAWTAPSLPTDQTPSDYHVNWAKDQEPFPDSAASSGYVEVTGSPHTLTGLDSGQTYRVRVRAHYPQGSNNAWNGPWTELEIVSATAELTGTMTSSGERNTPELLETATQNSVSTRALSTQAAAITHDSLDFATYITRVWVLSQHNLVELSWRRPTQNVSYRIWRAPAGEDAYTVLAEGNDVTTIAQPAKSGSRFYYTDKTVTAATSYKYAIQVLDLDSSDYSAPYEALASTTEWIPPRTTTLQPVALPTNEHGDYLVGVGQKARALIYAETATTNYVLTLQAGEAYRVELYDPFVFDGGHSHVLGMGEEEPPAFVGPIEVSGTAADDLRPFAEHAHGHYHMFLDSITQVANDQTIQFQSNLYQTPLYPWRVYWGGNLLNSCCSSAQQSYVFHAPAAGEYRIGVETEFGPTQFEFKVTRIPDQPDIPSFRARHSMATVGGGELGHRAAGVGNIGIDDQDWFVVKLEGAKSYRVSLHAGHFGWQGLSNPRFAAMAGPDGVQVQPGFSGGSRDQFILNVPRDEGGYYHIGVSGASASDRGLYVFTIVEDDFPTSPRAPVVGVGQQIIGMLKAESDVDWIGANLQAGRTYKVTVSGSSGDIDGRVFARSISLGSKVRNTNGQTMTLSSPNHFRLETAAHHSGVNGNVHYLTGKIMSATWKVAASGRYFFEIKKGEGNSKGGGMLHGAYYFQITDITP